MIDKLRNLAKTVFGQIYGVFLNILIRISTNDNCYQRYGWQSSWVL